MNMLYLNQWWKKRVKTLLYLSMSSMVSQVLISNISKLIGYSKLERYIFASKLKKLREKIIYNEGSATRLNFFFNYNKKYVSEKYVKVTI